MSLIHATCVSIGDAGVLLCGAPGSGKSDLALRLIDGGGFLIADDQVRLTRQGQHVVAQTPPALDGLLEVRGLGIVRAPSRPHTTLALIVDLEPNGTTERLPAPSHRNVEGIAVPRLVVAPRHPSAAAIVRLALRTIKDSGSLAGALGDTGRLPRGVPA